MSSKVRKRYLFLAYFPKLSSHSFAVPPHVKCSTNCPNKRFPTFHSLHTRSGRASRLNKVPMLSKMPTAAKAVSSSCTIASPCRRPAALILARAAAPLPASWLASSLPPPALRRMLMCQVALAAVVPSSSPESMAEEEAETAAKIGARIRVKKSVKIYHVTKAPDLDLCGMEGVIKQYVGVWKGRRISANLPFKVEFLLPVGLQEKPAKFVAHLREEEFEYLASSD